MLTEHHKVTFPAWAGRDELGAEVNWDDKEKTKGSQIVRFSLGDKVAYVKRDDLLQFFFAIAESADQRKMIPQTIHRVHEQTMKLAIKATKDIKKGEEIVMNDIKVSIPCAVVDKIGHVNVERGMSNLPILGKYLKPAR